MMLLAFIVIVALIAVFLFNICRKPDTFSYSRQIDITATPEKIFTFMNVLKNQSLWSPFEKDPNMKKTFTGPEVGPGAAMEWTGDNNVGAGVISITDATPPTKLVMRLQMTKPMKCDNVVTFTLTPHGDTTTVVWQMSGPQPFMGKVIATVIDCEKMVGRDFEKGLASLKALAEK